MSASAGIARSALHGNWPIWLGLAVGAAAFVAGATANLSALAPMWGRSSWNWVAVVAFAAAVAAFLQQRSIDLQGLQRAPGRTFRWAGEYGFDLNDARTLETQLNVFAEFRPEIPEAYKESELVFLANIDPDLQRQVLGQVRSPKLVAADTMNFWIDRKFEALRETLKSVNVLLINDAETRQLAREPNLALSLIHI